MHKKETFQKLATLLSTIAPEKWSSLQSIFLFHDGAMKLKQYYKSSDCNEWKSFNAGPSGFELMDWWQAYHGLVLESEKNEFKAAKAIIDNNGNLKIKLSYEVIDPLTDIELLEVIDKL